MNPILESLVSQTEPVTGVQIAVNTCCAFLLGLFVTWVYRRTHRHVSYSFSFVNTLMLLSMIMTLVMMVIGSSLARAFGLVGAMSVIRFRTVVKDTRDTAFVFYALAVGMACGTNNVRIAILGTALVGALICVLHWSGHAIPPRDNHLLRFNMVPTDDQGGRTIYQSTFDTYLKSSSLVHVKSVRAGQFLQLLFRVRLKDPSKKEDYVYALMALEGLDKVSITPEEESAQV